MLAEKCTQFCDKAKGQVENIVLSHIENGICTDVNAADKNPIRAYCDATEILTMFGVSDSFSQKELLLNELLNADTNEVDYTMMCVGYALENFGLHIKSSVSSAAELNGEKLKEWLNTQYNKQRGWPAWSFGSDTDALGTAFYQNKKHFGLKFDSETLFGWLEQNVNLNFGMWGNGNNVLDMVNGFYRLTRGTYAQFNVELPMPEKVIDIVLEHSESALEKPENINACNTLDIIHPLWLCKRQTDYRFDEGCEFALKWIENVLANWVDGKGFAFELLDHDKTSMMGTEMWLSILYLLCDYTGVSNALNYVPKGIHRPYTEI